MIEFTDEEVETIKEIICEWGSDYPCTDYEKVQELKYKLGLEKRPTAEELAEQERKRKEFADSPFGKQMAEIMSRSNAYLEEFVTQAICKDNILFFSGPQWKLEDFKILGNAIGPNLKINLPEDFKVKELPNV